MKSDIPALFGGRPTTTRQSVSRLLSVPEIGDEEIEAVKKVLLSGKLTRFSSDEVEHFEEEFSDYIGTKFALGVNSGTAALHASLAALGIGPGDEVIVPSYSYMATAHSVVQQNAIPIFVDIDPRTFTISPSAVEEAISEKTKAIIVVHLFGCPAEMDVIMKKAKQHQLHVIEDCCQACGAEYKDKKVGSIGDVGCFSFVESKNMTTAGEGGAITTNSSEIDHDIRIVAHEGEVFEDGTSTTTKPKKLPILPSMFYSRIGYNYRMSAVEATVGRVQIKKLDEMNSRQINNARYMTQELGKIKDVVPPEAPRNVKHVFTDYVAILESEKVDRDLFVKCLNAEGIAAGTYYPIPLPYNPVFASRKGYGKTECPFACPLYNKVRMTYKKKFPISEKVCNNHIFLPVHRSQRRADLNSMIKAMMKVTSFFDKFDVDHDDGVGA